MKARVWIEHLARDEWGNEVMKKVAEARFAADPSIDVVTVHEHAGWSLSWNRAGDVVGTANDAAWFPQRVRDFCRQFAEFVVVGDAWRDTKTENRWPGYFPVLAVAAVA